jgi:putative inorganic carbon (hco3(-)) transporter
VRDFLVFAIVILALPYAIRKPFIGLVLFSWLAYMRPQDLCWGFARTMRLSFFASIAMIVGWWAYEQGKRSFARWDVRTTLMMLLATLVTISYAFAQKQDNYTNATFFDFLKIITIAMFTTGQVDSRLRLRVIYWTIALSLGFFGVKNGLLGIARGGSAILRGPGGMLEDNNDFALALTMNVPLLWYLGIEAKGQPWVRRAAHIGVFLTVVTIVLTHSRGAFLALSMTALWIAWRSGHLARALFALAVMAAIFPLVAPEEVLERLASIGDTKESSANARLLSWGVALNLIAANPLFGVGLRNFQSRYVEYADYHVGEDGGTHVAHNSYLQIWAEGGSLAFAVYLGLLFVSLLTLRRVFRMSRLRPDLAWAGNYARMMEATTIGFMVGAFFLDRGHFDLIYHWFALVTCLSLVATAAWRAGPETVAVSRVPTQQVTVRRKGRRAGWRDVEGAAPAPGWR